MAITRGVVANMWCPVTAALAVTGADVNQFMCPQAPDTHDRTLWLSAIGAGAVPTTATADLEGSSDGGVTWQKVATALALVATSVATMQKVTNVGPGILLRINLTTLTLGGASSVTINALCA